MADTWSGTIARIGVPTGDGRILAPAGISHRALPLPLSWQRTSNDGHLSSIVVGRIDGVDIDPMAGEVSAHGVLLDEATTPEVTEVKTLLEHGVIGPSVDPGAVEYEVVGGGWDEQDRMMPELVLFTRYEIAGATLVSVPAFAGLGIRLGEPMEAAALTAAVRSEGWCDLPVADREYEWDGAAAGQRVAAWAGVEGEDATESDWAQYSRAFLLRDDDADPMTKGAYKMGIADAIDGTLTLVPAGVFAAASVLGGGRGGVDAPAEEQDRMRSALSGVYECADLGTPPWDDDEEMAAAVTACATALPPAAWYDDPKLDSPTPLTITADGRVYGHIADWSTCHVGLPGCVTPPISMTNYAYFTTGSTLTAEGSEVPVGKLTVGTGHADPSAGFQAAAEHYDHTGTVVAAVAAGEDAHGIWVAGAIVPEATVEQVEALRRSPISGDWRRIGGNLELVAALAVNVPGFPVPRARAMVAAGGEQLSLVASARFDDATKAEASAGTLVDPDGTIAVTVPDGRDGARRRARAKLALAKTIGRA